MIDSLSPYLLQLGLWLRHTTYETHSHTNTITDHCLLCAASLFLRFMVPSHPLCLERGVTYTLRFEFVRFQDTKSVLNGAASAILLVDSVRSIFPTHRICQSQRITSFHSTHKSCSLSLPPSVSLAPSLIIRRLSWCHDTLQWICSVQEIRLLTAENRPMSAIAATRGQRVWCAR